MKARAVDGLLVTGVWQVAKLPFQAATVVLLPRLLEPSDFGVYAMVLPILSFMLLVLDFGFTQAVIQSPGLTQAQTSALFWINVVVGFFFAALLLICAPLVADLYREPRVEGLVAACSVFMIVSGFGNVPGALLNRRMLFGWIAFIDALGVALGLVAAVIASLLHAHHWALLLEYFVIFLIGVVLSWIVSGWLPKERPDFRGVWRLVRFGGGVMLSDFGTSFSRHLDSMLIGRFAGRVQLGFYDRANKLAVIPMERINTLLKRVMLPIFSRLNEEPERYRAAYLRLIRLIMLATLPGMVCLPLTAPVLIPFLLGSNWTPAAPIFAWLAVAAVHYPVSMTMNWVFVSQGRAGAFLTWSVFNTTTCAIAFVSGLPWGALGVAIAFALSELLIRLPFLWWCVTRRGPVRMMDLYGAAAPFAAAALVSAGVVALLQIAKLPNDFAHLAISATASYAISGLVLCLFPRGRSTMVDALRFAASEWTRWTERLKGLASRLLGWIGRPSPAHQWKEKEPAIVPAPQAPRAGDTI